MCDEWSVGRDCVWSNCDVTVSLFSIWMCTLCPSLSAVLIGVPRLHFSLESRAAYAIAVTPVNHGPAKNTLAETSDEIGHTLSIIGVIETCYGYYRTESSLRFSQSPLILLVDILRPFLGILSELILSTSAFQFPLLSCNFCYLWNFHNFFFSFTVRRNARGSHFRWYPSSLIDSSHCPWFCTVR
jgi:hypothetical protein